MSAARIHALVVGDRFIGADLFAGALEAAADRVGVPLTIERLQIDYPAVDAVPLPTLAPAAPPRPLWEDPQEAVARAVADLSADPTIREYTGPVDLLVPHLAGIEAESADHAGDVGDAVQHLFLAVHNQSHLASSGT